MERLSRTAASVVTGVVRVTLSGEVSREVLTALHDQGLRGPVPAALRALLATAGVEHLAPVYTLAPAEIADDAYGFAREFTMVLQPGRALDDALAVLKGSVWVAEVKPLLLRHPS